MTVLFVFACILVILLVKLLDVFEVASASCSVFFINQSVLRVAWV